MKRARLTDARVLCLGWQALFRELGSEGALRFTILIDQRSDVFEARIRKLLLESRAAGERRAETNRSSWPRQNTA
jgi:hypothetical protein